MIYTVTFNPAIDYVVRLDAPLEVGEVNRAQGEDCVLGGKGINVSGVLAQLGCEKSDGSNTKFNRCNSNFNPRFREEKRRRRRMAERTECIFQSTPA